MRALVYSDLQATDGHEKCHGDPTVSLQIARVDAFYQFLLRVYEEYKCDCLWDLGDTTDDRSSIPVPAIDVVCGNLAQFRSSPNSLKLIGNHEQYLRDTSIHVGRLFTPYFKVIEGCEAIHISDKVCVLACSYPADNRDIVEWLKAQKKIKQSKKVVLLGHFQVMGSITGEGQLLAGIPKSEISWVDLGLLGHVHKPQSVHKNVHYIGSPFQQDWGEQGEDKRVVIVDISGDKINYTWIPVEGFPRYLNVTVDDFTKLCTPDTEDRFKVVIRSQKEATQFYALSTATKAEPVYDFDVTTEATGAKADEKITGKITGNAWSFDNVMRRYVERNTPDSKGVPATVEEMLEYGNEIALA